MLPRDWIIIYTVDKIYQVINKGYTFLDQLKPEFMIDIRHVLEEYSFQIALAVGHKTDNNTPHEYDYEKQVTILE